MSDAPTADYVDDVVDAKLPEVLVRELLLNLNCASIALGDHRWRVEPTEYPDALRLVHLDLETREPTGYVVTASVSVSGWLTGPALPPPPPRTSPVTIVFEGGHTVEVDPDGDAFTVLRATRPVQDLEGL